MATETIGHVNTGVDPGRAVIAEDDMFASVANNVDSHCWMHTIKCRVGRNTSSTFMRVIIYATDEGSDPDPKELRAWGPSDGVGVLYDADNDGSLYTTYVAGGDRMALAGENLAICFHAQGPGSLVVGYLPGAGVVYEQEKIFYRLNVTDHSSAGIPDPMGWTGESGITGQFQAWIEGRVNVGPDAPTSVSIGPTSSITPTITANFHDDDDTYGDYMLKSEVQARRKSDSVSFWASGAVAVSTTERDNDQSADVYAGTTLVRGTPYQMRVRHYDRTDTAGAWSGWVDFTPAALGSVTLVGNPTGKTDDTSPDVQFTWAHTAALSTDRAQVQFLVNGVVVATSSEVTLTVANGVQGTIPWASMGIAATLNPGQSYTYKVRGRDTGAVWSAYSPTRTFKIDAAPTTPTALTPTGNTILSNATYPVLTCKASDSDDTVATGLVVKAEILTGAGALISTRSMTLRGGTTDTWDYQTVAGDLAAVGSYKWRAYSGDGYLWSGGATVEASATRSAESLFQWQAVPNPVITAPADASVLTTASPTITWTVTNQSHYRLRIMEDGTALSDSGWIANTGTRSINLVAGTLRNGHTYGFEIGVRYLSLDGFDTNTVTLTYVPPASPENFSASHLTIGAEPFATAAALAWDASVAANFDRYAIERSDLALPLALITSISQTSYIDYHIPAGGATYSLRVVETVSLDEVESEEATATVAPLPIQGVVLVSATEPSSVRFVSPAWQKLDFELEGEETQLLPWGAAAPLAVVGAVTWWSGGIQFMLNEETNAPVLSAKAALEELARGASFSYRDRDGYKEFMRIPRGGLKMERERYGRYIATAKVIQTAYTEGVSE